MSFIEKQRHGNHYYYYLVKNVRLPHNKIRKFRISLGRNLPSKEEIQKAAAKLEKNAGVQRNGGILSPELIEKLEDLRSTSLIFKKMPDDILPKDFLVRFTYNTNAIEGNQLTLRQTALVLSDNIAPEGTRADDIIEALNSKDVWEFIKSYRGQLSKKLILKTQYNITKNTACRIQGDYRNSEVRISGSSWIPPKSIDIPEKIDQIIAKYRADKLHMHPIEVAAQIHCSLVQIHPFTDGNGRTARLLMNWILIKNKFPPVIIEVKNKEAYYKAIEEADNGNQKPFAEFVASQMLKQYVTEIEPNSNR